MTVTTTERRAWLIAWCLGALGCGEFFGGPPDAALPPLPDIHADVHVPDAATALVSPPVDAGARLVLPTLTLSLGSAVEVKHSGSDQWVELKIGDPVTAGDSIRTKGEQDAELAFDFGHVKLRQGSDFTLQVLDAHLVRAQVNGRAEVDVDGGQLALSGLGSDAVVTSNGGRLSVFSDGKATAVASLDGNATVAGGGKSLQLRSGEFSTAKGGGVSKPAKIPSKIALKVEWPPDADPDKETNKTLLTLRGRVSAFSEVVVQGKPVRNQSADGSFVVDVSLHKGKQRITVAAKDVLGRHKAEARTVTMDPDAPDIKGKVEYR